MKEANFGCIEAQAYLPLYVGEDLDAPAISAVRAHLEGCATCATSLAALRAALAAFAPERERVDAKIDLWAGIERELAAAGKFTGKRNVGAGTTPATELALEQDTALALERAAAPVSASLSAASAPRAGRGPSSLRRWSYLAAAAAAVLIAWRFVDTSPAGAPIDSPNSVQREVAKSEAPEVRSGPESESAAPATLDALTAPGASARTGELALVGDPKAPAVLLSPSVDAPNASPVDGLRRLSDEEALLREHLAPGAGRNGAYSLAGSQGLR
jgi:hypothetical protein